MIIKSIKSLKKIIKENDNLFVRWSRGFEFDKKMKCSRDHVSGQTHSGLSAIKIESSWLDDDKYLAKRLTEYAYLGMQDGSIKCQIYKGNECGYDSDGYESISIVEHVGQLSGKVAYELFKLKF